MPFVQGRAGSAWEEQSDEAQIARQWLGPYKPAFDAAVPHVFFNSFFHKLCEQLADLMDQGVTIPAVISGAQLAHIVKLIDPGVAERFTIYIEAEIRRRQKTGQPTEPQWEALRLSFSQGEGR